MTDIIDQSIDQQRLSLADAGQLVVIFCFVPAPFSNAIYAKCLTNEITGPGRMLQKLSIP